MPIQGLTDQARVGLPTLGKLHKGDVRPQDGKSPGRELPYFRFVSTRPAVVEAFTKAYGAKPETLPVYLPYPGAEENFESWQEAWAAGGLVHRCDGVNTILRREGNKYVRDPIPCPGGCKPIGRLVVILPKLWQCGHVGFVVLETHSINDIRSITSTLRAMSELGGMTDLRGQEFILRRVPEMISTPGGDKGRMRRESFLVKLEPTLQWAQLRLLVAPTSQVPAQIDTSTGEIVEGAVVSEEPASNEEPAATVAPAVEAPEGPELGPVNPAGFGGWWGGMLNTFKRMGLETEEEVLNVLRQANYDPAGMTYEHRMEIVQAVQGQLEQTS